MDAFQEKINQIQLLQQNLEHLSVQRQQFQIQETEIEATLKELENSKTCYKIIGNVMIGSDSEKLKSELVERGEMLKIRIDSIEKQETRLKEKFEELQKEALSEIDKNERKKKTNPGDTRSTKSS